MSEQPRLFKVNDPDIFPHSGKGIDKVSLSRKKRWVEDAHITGANERFLTHDYFGISLTKFLYVLLLSLVIIFFFAVYFRIFWLQIIKGKTYAVRSEENRTRHIAISAERGIIYDRNGVALVKNTPRFALRATPFDIPKNKEEFNNLSKLIASTLQKTNNEVMERLELARASYDREFLLFENITQEQAIMLSVYGSEIPSIHVVSGIRRTYEVNKNNLSSMSHIIGFEGKISEQEFEKLRGKGYVKTDYIGKQGVEMIYEDILRGEKGVRIIEVDSKGVGLGIISESNPVQGKSIFLTLDSSLQQYVESVMNNALRNLSLKRGVVIVQSVRDGGILAMASFPSFDNERFARGLSNEEYNAIIKDEDKPLINRAIQGLYPSGSTIKPIIAIASLEEGIITEQTTIMSSGGIKVGQWFFSDWNPSGHGRVSVKQAIANSVNTFFYCVGGGYEDKAGLGIDRIEKWLSNFGFGRQTKIDLSSDATGFIPTPEWKKQTKNQQWYIGDTYNVSIGQGDFLTTPLQILNAISAIANNGKLYVPHVLKNIEGNESKEIPFEKINANDNNFKIVRAGMREAVLYGSAQNLNNLPILVAGKTGTAQWSQTHKPHAWFVGFGPYSSPDISVLVLIEEGGEGSNVAVPIAKKIFEWWNKNAYPLN